jgi:hypothetical protein
MPVKIVLTEDVALTAASAAKRSGTKCIRPWMLEAPKAVELQIRRSFVGRGTPLSLSSRNSHSRSITVLDRLNINPMWVKN